MKRRLEIDLNCSLQESQEYSADCMEVDGRDDCFSGINIGNNNILNSRCSIDLNEGAPIFSDEMNRNEAYNMPIASPEFDSVGNKYSWKALPQNVLSNNSGDRLVSSVSRPALMLEVERSSADEMNMPPFFTLMGAKDLHDQNSERETSDSSPSLELSLALPYPKTGGSGRALKLDLEMKQPKCPEVNATLSLF